MTRQKIRLTTVVAAPIEKVWDAFWRPEHVVHWSFASDDWHCPQAVGEEPKVGGIFTHTFAAKDATTSFDFSGRYDEVEPMRRIQYTLGDASEVFTPSTRSVETTFTPVPSGVEVVQIFDTEDSHTLEQQKAGWAAILEHFRQYAESI